MGNIVYKYIDIKLVEPIVADGDGGLPIIHMGMTDSSEDRDGDTIDASGWDFSTFMGDASKRQGANPVVLWSHNAHLGEARPAVGQVSEIYQKDGMWVAKILFDDLDDFAMQLYNKYKRGFLRASSVGFLPQEYTYRTDENGHFKGIDFRRQQLLELSLVNVPAHPKALSIAAGNKGFKDGRDILVEKFLEEQKDEWTTAYINDLPNGAFAAVEPAYKNGDTDNKNARHLPHHDKNGDIDMPHLRNAMARMNQIQPVTDSISTEDLRAMARKNLAVHEDMMGSEEDSMDITQMKELLEEMLKPIEEKLEVKQVKEDDDTATVYQKIAEDIKELQSQIDEIKTKLAEKEQAETEAKSQEEEAAELADILKEAIGVYKEERLEAGKKLIKETLEETFGELPKK